MFCFALSRDSRLAAHGRNKSAPTILFSLSLGGPGGCMAALAVKSSQQVGTS
jgi:hypothetical protein